MKFVIYVHILRSFVVDSIWDQAFKVREYSSLEKVTLENKKDGVPLTKLLET